MAEYGEKFFDVIDSFESYSQGLIENCIDFIQTATTVGAKIGNSIGNGAGNVSSYIDDSTNKGAATKLGLEVVSIFAESVGAFTGNAIGEWRRKAKYKTAIKKIREDGLNWKKQCFELVPQSKVFFNSRIEDSEKELYIIKEKLLNSLPQKEEDKKNAAEEIRNSIKHIYQAAYRLELANRIIYYFDNFENQLYDLEIFSQWYENSVKLDKVECYKNCYEKVYDTIMNDVEEDSQNQIDDLFNILDSIVPILVFDEPENHCNLISYEISRLITSEIKGKKFIGSLPKTCYKTDGFIRMTSVFKDSFHGIVIPQFKKFRTLILTIPALITTGIYIILSLTGLFSFTYCFDSYIPNYLFIAAVFLIVEFFSICIVKIKKSITLNPKNLIKFCIKYNYPEFLSETYQICEDFADEEKEISENELIAEEQDNQRNLLTDENGKTISEDDFLDSLINT